MINIQTPLGSSIDFTNDVFKKAEEVIRSRPEVAAYFCTVGGFQGGLVNQGTMSVTLKDPRERPVAAPFKRRPSQQDFMGVIREEVCRREGSSPDLSVRSRGEAADERFLFSRGLPEVIPLLCFRIEAKETGMIVASEVDPILMVDGKSPGPHFGGERSIELSDFARVGVDGEEEEGSIILGKGEVNRIYLSRFSRAGIGPPGDRFPDRCPEITEGRGRGWED